MRAFDKLALFGVLDEAVEEGYDPAHSKAQLVAIDTMDFYPWPDYLDFATRERLRQEYNTNFEGFVKVVEEWQEVNQ